MNATLVILELLLDFFLIAMGITMLFGLVGLGVTLPLFVAYTTLKFYTYRLTEEDL